jgi:uncharacterized membrane protein YfcA
VELYLLVISFFLIALIYSSVGFGGGSSYLALLSLSFFSVQTPMIKVTALMCNIIVVTGGTFIFYREGKINLKKDWVYLATSIPMAFLGGLWPIKDNDFFVLLGVVLLVASVLLWIQPKKKTTELNSTKPTLQIPMAGSLGFLSGITSIGGGIFLSPALHLLRWKEAKEISALASVFILANSISGLACQLTKSILIDWRFIFPLLIAVFLGGQLGARLGAKWFNAIYIKRITALLIFVAAINILKDHW